MRRALHRLNSALATILLGGFLTATLIRVAPGFGIDPRESDPRLSAESRQALRAGRAGEQNVLRYYGNYLRGLLTGDLGTSQSWGRPVAGLLRERASATAVAVAWGVAWGWSAGLLLALLAVGQASRVADLVGGVLCALLLCVPAAVLALALVFAAAQRRPVSLVAIAITLVIFPQAFRYARGILGLAAGRAHVLAARGRGVRQPGIVFRHVLMPSLGPLLALAGVSVSRALGAAIPIEVVTGSNGLGQLAWQAAMQRDLPLLLNVALVVTAVAVVANSIADAAGASVMHEREAER